MEDLLILVADKNMQAMMIALLLKFAQVERIAPIKLHCVVHPNKDPGVLREGAAFVRPFQYRYHHALLMLDHEGCGQEEVERRILENDLQLNLDSAGWAGRSAAVVIAPELEQWIWLGETHVAQAIDWPTTGIGLHQWLEANDLKQQGVPKPPRPKEALRAALRHSRLPPSAAIVADIIRRGSYLRCVDPAFLKLLTQLREWFAIHPAHTNTNH
jgi:hypothetical protein